MICEKCNQEKPEEKFIERETGGLSDICLTCRRGGKCFHGKRKEKCTEGCKQLCRHWNEPEKCHECDQGKKCIHGTRRKRDCPACGGDNICEHQKIRGRCTDCGGKWLCPHKRQKNDCQECEGKNICIHKRRKRTCPECDGSSLCEHKKQRTHCIKCPGDHICPHGKLKLACMKCEGKATCIHKTQRYTCKKCGGNGICSHDIIRYNCKICHTQSFCIHGRRHDLCPVCRGKGICIHRKIFCLCSECGGSSLCKEHKKRKDQCVECGTAYCKHGTWTKSCPKCHPEKSCKRCGEVFIRKTSKFRPYCSTCFCIEFPDHEFSIKSRLKEKYFVNAIVEAFPDEKMLFNKTVPKGKSKRRPDIFIDRGDFCLINELDEHAHNGETTLQRAVRNHQLWKDIGFRPLIIIRFNPDSYTEDNEKYDSCFTFENGKMSVDEEEWKERFSILCDIMNNALNAQPAQGITEHYLFYGNLVKNGGDKLKKISTPHEMQMPVKRKPRGNADKPEKYCMMENKKINFRYIGKPKSELKSWANSVFTRTLKNRPEGILGTILTLYGKDSLTLSVLPDDPTTTEEAILEKYKACYDKTYTYLTPELKQKVIENVLKNKVKCKKCKKLRTKDNIFVTNNVFNPSCPACHKKSTSDTSSEKSENDENQEQDEAKSFPPLEEVLEQKQGYVKKLLALDSLVPHNVSLESGYFFYNATDTCFHDLMFITGFTGTGYSVGPNENWLSIPVDDDMLKLLTILEKRYNLVSTLQYDEDSEGLIVPRVVFAENCVIHHQGKKTALSLDTLSHRKYSANLRLKISGIDTRNHILFSIEELSIKSLEAPKVLKSSEMLLE